MQLEKYRNEIEKNIDEKLIQEELHKLTIREEDFKNFYLSNFSKIESDNNEIFLDELQNYEKELKFGETRI